MNKKDSRLSEEDRKTLKAMCANLKIVDGIYYSVGNKKVSYPEDGHSVCAQIETKSFWFTHRNSCIYEASRHFIKNQTIYDVGGGNGIVSLYLQNNGIQTVLIEPGANGALEAKKRGLKNIICAKLEDLDIKSNSIKAFGIFDVLEHIQDDNIFVSKLRKSMQLHGYIFLTVPAYSALWSNDDNSAGHYRRYSLRAVKNLFQKNGFKVVYATYIFSFLPLPIFLFKTLPWLLRLRSSNVKYNPQIHQVQNKFLQIILQLLTSWEINKIISMKKIHHGSSCLVVAQAI